MSAERSSTLEHGGEGARRFGFGGHRDDVAGHRSPASGPTAGRLRIRALDRVLDVVVFCWLFVLSEAVIPLSMLQHQEDFTDEQKIFFQNILKPFVVFSLCALVYFFRSMVSVLLRNPFILLIIVWMWMSAFWSMDHEVTVRRSIVHTSFIVIACFVALRYDFKELIAMLFYITAIVALSSLYFIVADPSLGFNIDGRGARGAFLHKNTLANFLVVGIMAAGAGLRLKIVPRIVGYGVLFLTIALLILANSTTAHLAVAVMVCVYVAMELRSRLPFRQVAVFTAFSLALVLFGTMVLIANLDDVFALLGRDMTLTGRDAVWHYASRMIHERILLGYGYAAFWETEPILSYVTETLKWHITHAHNGFLQIWLELGLVGFCLLVAVLMVSFRRLVSSSLPDRFASVALPFFAAMVVNDLVETHLFVYKHFGWIILLVLIFAATPGLERIRHRDVKSA